MQIDYFNSEGYPDPTQYGAFQNMAKELFAFRPIVYIASPFSGDVAINVENARRYSKYAVDHGFIPVAPHLLYPQFMDDTIEKDRELGMFFGIVLMSKCAEVWICGGRVSEGMEQEIRTAKKKGYKLRYFDNDMKEVNPYEA